jgi:hypothetical protein
MTTEANPAVYYLDARDRPHLLFAMMRELAGDNAWISFEGRLIHTDLMKIEGVVFEETEVLRRGTIAPRLDFLVLPLTRHTLQAIERAILSRISFHSTEGIVHVQIERDGTMAFAAYDNFSESCTWVYSTFPVALLDELVVRKVLVSYEAG